MSLAGYIANATASRVSLVEPGTRSAQTLGDVGFHLDGVSVYISADTAREIVADLTDRLTDLDGPVA